MLKKIRSKRLTLQIGTFAISLITMKEKNQIKRWLKKATNDEIVRFFSIVKNYYESIDQPRETLIVKLRPCKWLLNLIVTNELEECNLGTITGTNTKILELVFESI